MANSSKPKIVTFPNMGNVSIPVKAILEVMGAQIILPPKNSKAALNLGVRHSTEGVCLPYKLNLGNYIQALDAGANTILMFQAPGSCRLGNYVEMSKNALIDLGYDFELVVFNMYKGQLKEVVSKFSYACGGANLIDAFRGFSLGFKKFYLLDAIEKKVFYIRPREVCKGSAYKVYQKGIDLIDKAKTIKELEKIDALITSEYNKIEIDFNKIVPIVYLTGEFFILLDPFSNMEIEKELGLMGVEVQRQIMLSDWLEKVLKPKFLYKKLSHRERAVIYSKDFISRAIGGECLESIGDTVYAARNNVDGVIHLGPFNCNPEIVSQCILPKISRIENIPVLSLMMDEVTAKAGILTRLEAFTDLLFRRKMKSRV